MFLHVKKKWFIVKIFIGLHILSLILIMSPIVFPFSVKTPQRVFATHVNRQFFNKELAVEHTDSLIWIQNMERRGRNVLPFLHSAQSLNEYCEKNGYCGLPRLSKINGSNESTCIPSVPHVLNDDVSLKVVSRKIIDSDLFLEFNVSGSDHMGLIITPLNNLTLVDWNLPAPLNQSYNQINFVQGLGNSSLTVIIKAFKESPDSSIKVEVFGLYFHHDEYLTSDFNKFLSMFPKWSHVTPGLAVYKSYEF